jgi:hypothetical protein
VAVIKLTTDATANTLSNGDAVKTVLSKVLVNFTKNTTTTINSWTIEKCGGLGSSSVATAYTASGNGTATFGNVVNLGTSDSQIASQGTAYYAVKAYASALQTGTGNDWIQVDLSTLDGDSSTGNFGWKDSSESRVAYPLRLSISKVDGTKIVEP